MPAGIVFARRTTIFKEQHVSIFVEMGTQWVQPKMLVMMETSRMAMDVLPHAKLKLATVAVMEVNLLRSASMEAFSPFLWITFKGQRVSMKESFGSKLNLLSSMSVG